MFNTHLYTHTCTHPAAAAPGAADGRAAGASPQAPRAQAAAPKGRHFHH